MLTSRSRSARNAGSASRTAASSCASSSAVTSDPGASTISMIAVYEPRPWYSRRTVRLVEIRLLEGPNVYRLAPVVKIEVGIGRRRTWYGQREPGRHAVVRLGASVPRKDWPGAVEGIVGWVRRLRVDHDEG